MTPPPMQLETLKPPETGQRVARALTVAAIRLSDFRKHVDRCLDPQSEDFEDGAERPDARAFAAAEAFIAKYPLTDPQFLWAGNPSFDLFLSQVDGGNWRQVTVRFLGDGTVLIGTSNQERTVGVWPLTEFEDAEGDLVELLSPWIAAA